MYTEKAFESMYPSLPAEVLRCDLAGPILRLKALGVSDFLAFEWLDHPQEKQAVLGIDMLFAYGLID